MKKITSAFGELFLIEYELKKRDVADLSADKGRVGYITFFLGSSRLKIAVQMHKLFFGRYLASILIKLSLRDCNIHIFY